MQTLGRGSDDGDVGRVLGPLASVVMRIVWERGPTTVGDVADTVRERQSRDLAYTTVMTIMTRLHERGLLTRVKRGRQFVYEAASTEPELLDALSGRAVDDLIERYGRAAYRQFAQRLAELHPDVRDHLLTLAAKEDE
jgi:predicted transcriptional regulator